MYRTVKFTGTAELSSVDTKGTLVSGTLTLPIKKEFFILN
jgi:hypothetical protein